jgi:hypothetical protein
VQENQDLHDYADSAVPQDTGHQYWYQKYVELMHERNELIIENTRLRAELRRLKECS